MSDALGGSPQALFDPSAMDRLAASVSGAGPDVLGQVTATLRSAVAGAISDVFLIGAGLVAVAFVASFFLREIPLRRRATAAASAGTEMIADVGGEPVASNDPIPDTAGVQVPAAGAR